VDDSLDLNPDPEAPLVQHGRSPDLRRSTHGLMARALTPEQR